MFVNMKPLLSIVNLLKERLPLILYNLDVIRIILFETLIQKQADLSLFIGKNVIAPFNNIALIIIM